jgi:hypothetical protein
LIDADALAAVKAKLLAAAEASPSQTPAVLLMRAARHLDSGEFSDAASLARRAYGLDSSMDAFALLFPDSEASPEASLRKAEGLLAGGFNNARLTEIMAVMATRLHRPDDVRRLMDPDRFLRMIQLPTLDAAERAALVRALQANLKHYTSPSDRAIRYAGRREGLREQTTVRPVVARMFVRLRTTIEEWIDTLPSDATHPFLAGKPARFRLDGWSVVSGRDGHHVPHMHSESWANGVYYVEIPTVVEDERRRPGWLRVGPPPSMASAKEMAGPSAGSSRPRI